MIDRLLFVLSEAKQGFRRNTSMTLASISTAAVALFLLGSLAFLYVTLGQASQSLPGKFDLRVFLRDSATARDVQATATALRKIPGVKSATWIPKDKAWERDKRELPPEFTRGVENPYPHAFKVTLNEISEGPQVADRIRTLPAVDPRDGVQYLKDEQRLMEQALVLIRWLGATVGGLLVLTGGVLIYNTTRLALIARRRERRIMELVGASWIMVALPYILEGLVAGFVGGLLATLLVVAAHTAIQSQLADLTALGKLPPLNAWLWLQGLCYAGMGFGTVCSLLALSRREPA